MYTWRFWCLYRGCVHDLSGNVCRGRIHDVTGAYVSDVYRTSPALGWGCVHDISGMYIEGVYIMSLVMYLGVCS